MRAKPGPVRWTDVSRELGRARAARRLVPWVIGSVVALGVLVAVAAGTWRAAGVVLAPGALLLLVVLSSAVARCPACGVSLRPRRGSEGAGGFAGLERTRRCPRCGAGYT